MCSELCLCIMRNQVRMLCDWCLQMPTWATLPKEASSLRTMEGCLCSMLERQQPSRRRACSCKLRTPRIPLSHGISNRQAAWKGPAPARA